MHITTRPRGIKPGTMEWLREIEGPRLLEKLVRVVHGEDEFSPTQARVAGMLMDRVAPTVSSVHHTVESSTSKMTTQQLKDELKLLLAGEAIDVEAIEVETIEGGVCCAQCGRPVASCGGCIDD